MGSSSAVALSSSSALSIISFEFIIINTSALTNLELWGIRIQHQSLELVRHQGTFADPAQFLLHLLTFTSRNQASS